MPEVRADRSSIWLPLLAGLMLSVLAGYLGWTLGSSAGAPVPTASEAAAAPILSDFRLPSLDGGELGPSDFRGQVVLVDFWATWCSPCRVQARLLDALWEEVKADGVQFLAVSVGEEREVVERFVENSPYPYPVLYDTADSIATQAEIYALPTVMVLDPTGRVVYFEAGLSDTPTLRKALESARL